MTKLQRIVYVQNVTSVPSYCHRLSYFRSAFKLVTRVRFVTVGFFAVFLHCKQITRRELVLPQNCCCCPAESFSRISCFEQQLATVLHRCKWPTWRCRRQINHPTRQNWSNVRENNVQVHFFPS